MKSTIRVKHDFNRNEAYLQVRIDGVNEEDGDMKDEHLAHFVQRSNGSLMYTQYDGGGEYLPQIRILDSRTTPNDLLEYIADSFAYFAKQYYNEGEWHLADTFFTDLKERMKRQVNTEIPIANTKS